MASDKERREAAENLRSLTIGHQIRYAEQFFDALAEREELRDEIAYLRRGDGGRA